MLTGLLRYDKIPLLLGVYMLKLLNITKDYKVGDQVVHALRGIDLEFGESGFVSILGQSGCGKTTLMNVIGGLDRYTTGDVVIDGVSTKDYSERDWNTYRNDVVGFVFQSYNLIPHMTVLANVELALTLSGIKGAERKERSLAMLEKVGLKEQAHKRPNQLSGGQCQRVAIARALVNDPEIILADEPTGAIDSETAVTIMDLLKEVSSSKLVIMVTHNPELAERYSDRIITMKDGKIVSERIPDLGGKSFEVSGGEDIDFLVGLDKSSEEEILLLNRAGAPAPEPDEEREEREPTNKKRVRKGKKKRSSMSFRMATKLSFNNLIHKKGRTIMTVIAGSIGIICIFLILAMNSGFSKYIREYETESLAKYPVEVTSESNSFLTTLQRALNGKRIDLESVDLQSAIDLFSEEENWKEKYTEEEIVYLSKVLLSVIDDMSLLNKKLKTDTDISKFSEYMKEHYDPAWGTVRRDYGFQFDIYEKKGSSYTKINPISEPIINMASLYVRGIDENVKSQIKSVIEGLNVWTMMVDDKDVLNSQYDVLAGEWPDYTTEEGRNGLVLVVDEYNSLDDTTLVFLNRLGMVDLITSFFKGDTSDIKKEYPFEDFLDAEYALMPSTDYYTYNLGTKLYQYDGSNDALDARAIPLKISAIVRLKEGLTAGCIGGTIGYTQALAEYVMRRVYNSDMMRRQRAEYERYKAAADALEELALELAEKGFSIDTISPDDLTEEQKKIVAAALLTQIHDVRTGEAITEAQYNQMISDMQVKEEDKPNRVFFYPSSIESKNEIVKMINAYNEIVKSDPELAEERTDYAVGYTDDLSEITASMRSMIDTITYVLVAVAIIAVVVAMLLVAIILYISVQDRTKEIGILRAIGAGKLNVSELFVAETFIIGLVSGLVGILLGYILSFPADALIYKYLQIPHLLYPRIEQAALLVVFSFVTTVISGLVPAMIAAKKDPVIALRTE